MKAKRKPSTTPTIQKRVSCWWRCYNPNACPKVFIFPLRSAARPFQRVTNVYTTDIRSVSSWVAER